MIFTKTKLQGTIIIEIEKKEDDRGFFARAWCKNEFEEHGLAFNPVQANIAFSKTKGILRGMHYQIAPHEEAKLIRCIRGAIYDVIIDLRPDSSTYKQWIGVELGEDNYKMLYIPEGFAHGYQALTDNTEVYYQVSQFYSPKSERGVRWDDPAFGINWLEIDKRIVSEKDKCWPNYTF
jgi:dTDP-4-dehydrorhamnose 3,5-epimerase